MAARCRQGGFDQLDGGEETEFESMHDFDAYIDQIGEEVSADLAAERKLANKRVSRQPCARARRNP
ncbi:MAG: hypothetical protein WKF37_24200 [Bryobacteraceae bacterium]